MPVSHLGLTVSHIPSATSFYLSALQPLGYRFIGHQGDSIGLGVNSADFFLTQSPHATQPSPNHIAFLADSRLAVRDCYAAALTSGGLPSGAPSYRNEDCSCFNAAVEDLDGNTVEFIFRQPHGENGCCEQSAPSEGNRVLDWQKDVAQSAGADDEVRSVSQVSRGSLASQSRTKSRMHTALDLASASTKSTSPKQAISTAQTKPDFPSKTLIGTALGAAAGAALMYAMTKAESKNAKEEADHLAYMASKSSRRRASREHESPPFTTERDQPASNPPLAESRKFHRNYSTTESAISRRQPPAPTHAMRMIEATGYNREDDDVQEVMARHNSMRPRATRSRTHDDYEYVAASNVAHSVAPSGYGIKRASTMPEGHTERSHYYLEAPPPRSTRQEAAPRSVTSHSSRRSHRRGSIDDANIKRHDSGVSMHSHRSRREREGDSERRSSASKSSTVKPSRREHDYTAAITAEIPLIAESRAASSCYHPAAISLPPSQASSHAARLSARVQSMPDEPLNPSKESWEDFASEDSDGLGDVRTVLPEDSISVVDLSKPRRSSHSSHSKHRSKHSSRRSEASTVKPARKDREGSRHGTVLPYRSRPDRDERRSVRVS